MPRRGGRSHPCPPPVPKTLALALIGALLAACDSGVGGGLVEGVPGSSTATPAITDAPQIDLPATAVETIATGLRIPWGLAFLLLRAPAHGRGRTGRVAVGHHLQP